MTAPKASGINLLALFLLLSGVTGLLVVFASNEAVDVSVLMQKLIFMVIGIGLIYISENQINHEKRRAVSRLMRAL